MNLYRVQQVVSLFHYNIDEMPQERNSCSHQQTMVKLVYCTGFHLKSQNLLMMLREDLTVIKTLITNNFWCSPVSQEFSESISLRL